MTKTAEVTLPPLYSSIVEEGMTSKPLSPCIKCSHKFRNAPGCEAFPQEIPMEIRLGKNKHTESHPDQKNDIVFEKGTPIS